MIEIKIKWQYLIKTYILGKDILLTIVKMIISNSLLEKLKKKTTLD